MSHIYPVLIGGQSWLSFKTKKKEKPDVDLKIFGAVNKETRLHWACALNCWFDTCTTCPLPPVSPPHTWPAACCLMPSFEMANLKAQMWSSSYLVSLIQRPWRFVFFRFSVKTSEWIKLLHRQHQSWVCDVTGTPQEVLPLANVPEASVRLCVPQCMMGYPSVPSLWTDRATHQFYSQVINSSVSVVKMIDDLIFGQNKLSFTIYSENQRLVASRVHWLWNRYVLICCRATSCSIIFFSAILNFIVDVELKLRPAVHFWPEWEKWISSGVCFHVFQGKQFICLWL